MGYGDFDEDAEFAEFLRLLISMKHLDGAVEGITKLVINKGLGALTDKQRYVFDRDVADPYITEECSRCGSNIPWSEMYEAHDNGGLCGWCDHMLSKDD